jgi:arylsulfatase A-like enzyme
VDDRLVGWQDVMPTLLDLAGVAIPSTVEGLSMVGEQRREWLYGEIYEGAHATRMIRSGRYKLIYYATGHHRQLFDLETDPHELHDLSGSPAYATPLAELTQTLISQLYGGDEAWVQEGQLVGWPNRPFVPGPNRGLTSQRGSHWPPPPRTDMPQIDWHQGEEVTR